MKILKYFLSIIITMFLLTGCGGEMQDWPYCDLPDKISQYQNISIEISKNSSYPENGNITTTKYVGVTEKAVFEIYNVVERLHVSPKPIDIEITSYVYKVSIVFSSDSSDYVFEFYGLGITKGYFVFNYESTYLHHGDFVGVIIGNIEYLSSDFIKV